MDRSWKTLLPISGPPVLSGQRSESIFCPVDRMRDESFLRKDAVPSAIVSRDEAAGWEAIWLNGEFN